MDLHRWGGLLLLVAGACAGMTACGSSTASSGPATPPASAGVSSAHASVSATQQATALPTTQQATPRVTQKVVREHHSIPFAAVTRDSATLDKGVTKVVQAGRAGVQVAVYRETLTNGVVSGRRLVRKSVERQPVAQITMHGTHVDAPKPTSNCDPNYSGACVPIASDVDCAGRSGNGPAYVSGPVRVVGVDIYDLDSDGDGYGCE